MTGTRRKGVRANAHKADAPLTEPAKRFPWSRDHEDGGPTIQSPAANGRCTLDEAGFSICAWKSAHSMNGLRRHLRMSPSMCDENRMTWPLTAGGLAMDTEDLVGGGVRR